MPRVCRNTTEADFEAPMERLAGLLQRGQEPNFLRPNNDVSWREAKNDAARRSTRGKIEM